MNADPSAEEVLARRFRVQGLSCAELGSPLYGGLMERAAEDIESRGLLFELLEGREAMPGPMALALRLFGAVHRLVLEERAPELARFYPSAGGKEDPGPGAGAAWPAFRATVAAHRQECRAAIDSPPQTNEVGRSAALLPGLIEAFDRTGKPLRLLEVGASAGLNLLMDRFSYERRDGHRIGDAGSPVRFPASWYPGGLEGLTGDRPVPPVLSREGCDRAPLDVGHREGALTLASFVWPDQIDRLARLLGAVSVAQAYPVEVTRADARDWLARRLRQRSPECCTVVFHSIVLQYLGAAEKKEVLATIGEAGQRATPEAPLAWLRMEPGRSRWQGRPVADVLLTLWPGGREQLLAHAGFHGNPVLSPGSEDS